MPFSQLNATYRKVEFQPIQLLMKSPQNQAPKRASKKKAKEEATWPLYLAAVIFLLGVYLVMNAINSGSEPVEDTVDPRQAELERQQKIDYYKRQLGEKLNRSRVLTEYELVKEANQPAPRHHEARGYRESLEGLPLDYEPVTFAPREQSIQVNDKVPDQRVAYDLQDDQNATYWEEEARNRFLREYLLNARAKGYDLAIDSDYNVIVRKSPKRIARAERMPQNAQDNESLAPLVLPRFRPPFFSPPPYCQ